MNGGCAEPQSSGVRAKARGSESDLSQKTTQGKEDTRWTCCPPLKRSVREPQFLLKDNPAPKRRILALGWAGLGGSLGVASGWLSLFQVAGLFRIGLGLVYASGWV